MRQPALAIPLPGSRGSPRVPGGRRGRTVAKSLDICKECALARDIVLLEIEAPFTTDVVPECLDGQGASGRVKMELTRLQGLGTGLYCVEVHSRNFEDSAFDLQLVVSLSMSVVRADWLGKNF